jgi:hypothetical protein
MSAAFGWYMWKFTPKGCERQLLRAQDVALHLLGRDRGTGEETEAARVAGRGDQLRVGYPAHRGLHHGVAAAEQLGEAGLQHDRGSWFSARCDRRAGCP